MWWLRWPLEKELGSGTWYGLRVWLRIGIVMGIGTGDRDENLVWYVLEMRIGNLRLIAKNLGI